MDKIEKLDLTKILFSFEGRIPRKVFWIYLLVSSTPCVFIGILLILFGNKSVVAVVVMGLLYLLMSWAVIAIYVKRLHDRDKSGWWMTIALVPIVGAFWMLIELGFMRGTIGENRFGSDATDLY